MKLSQLPIEGVNDGAAYDELLCTQLRALARVPKIHISIEDPADIEIRQSAEILYREFQSHGAGVVMDDRAGLNVDKNRTAERLGLPFRLTLEAQGLREGKVEIFARERIYRVNLEDAVLATMELINGL